MKPNSVSLIVGMVALKFTAAAAAQTYDWTTIAGNAGYGVADGTNSTARFSFPSGVAVDPDGNVYVADTANHTIRKLAPTGTNWAVSTIAGLAGIKGSADGTNSDARFYLPSSVTVHTSGDLFVSDGNYTVRKLTPRGTNWVVTTIVGLAGSYGSTDGTNSDARFGSFRGNSTGIATDKDGNLYVTDTWNYTIRRLTLVGTNWVVTTIAGLAGSDGSADGTNSDARFFIPQGIAVGANGEVYVADTGNLTMRKLMASGTNWVTRTIAGRALSPGSVDGINTDARFLGPVGVALDASENLILTDAGNHTIRKLTRLGTDWVSSTIAGLAGIAGSEDGTNSAARFGIPFGIALDVAGEVYLADSDNHTIRRLTPTGTNWVTSTIAGLAGGHGSTDGTNSAARFFEPYALALDGSGNVYVADTTNSIIRKVSRVGTSWVVSTIAGLAGTYGSADGTNTAARFGSTSGGPTGIAVDSIGNVYVADYGNSTIRKLTPMGTDWVVYTIAGLAGNTGSADGTNSTARFTHPYGIAVDYRGAVYVADTYSYTIRKLTLMGTNWVVSTIAGLGGNPGSRDGFGNAARFGGLAGGPNGIAVDGNGVVYVTDGGNFTIRQLRPTGANWAVSTIAGLVGDSESADGTNNAARFTWPTGIAVDRAGSVYVTDRIGNSVRKLTSVGTNWVTRTIGGLALNPGSADGTGSVAWFNYPSGVAVDSDGILYVADSRNSTIRVGTPLPLFDFLAGNPDSSIDRQTGLFYQHVVVTNVGAGTIRGLQISVANLPAGVRLVSATGTNAATGGSFIEFTNALASGATLTFTLSYYSSNRQTPFGVAVSVRPTTVSAREPGVGEIVAVRRTYLRSDGTLAVEFDSVAGRSYAIEYSSDLSLWRQAQSLVSGNGGRMIWVDAGPPDTDSLPSGNRFYKVILITQ